ncbi:MAG: hypothetical protein AAGH15_08080 [Myxococcota bacterium]
MRRLAWLALLVAACGGGTTTARGPDMDDLRRRAEARPDDARAWRVLAEAELLAAEGDPGRARAAIDRALQLDPARPSLHLMSGLEHHHHGRPGEATDAFVSALEQRGSEAQEVAALEVAAGALEGLAELAPDFPTRVEARLAAIVDALPPAARVTVTDLLVDLAYRGGDVARASRLAEAAGCVRAWRVAGPIGPRDLLGFDATLPAEGPAPLPAQVDLGPLRGERPVREVQSRGCATHLGEGPVADAGTTLAEASFRTTGAVILRLETPNSVALSVDGEELVRLDHRRVPHGRVSFHRLALPAGEHALEVKLTTRHPNPILHVAVLPEGALADPGAAASPLGTYLGAALPLARGDVIGAREALRATGEGPGSTVLRDMQATVALTDPFLAPDQRRDRSRALFEGIAARDAEAWYARLQLARLMAAEGRDREAMDALRAVAEAHPALVPLHLTLVELLMARGWDAQADVHVERAVTAGPGLCAPIRAALASAQRRDRTREIDDLADRLVACDARDAARYTRLVQARRWERAREELDRLAGLEPPQGQARFFASRLDLAEASEDPEAIRAATERLVAARPQSETPRLELADLVLAGGDVAGAREVLGDAIEREPAAMAELRRIRTMLGEAHELAGFRRDGAEAIATYEAAKESGRVDYQTGQVLVFDYTAQRVYDDGSSLSLTHQIYAVQSEEAVDELGQFVAPEGAYVLTLGTRKPGGRLLEPDLIEGMGGIALTSLAVGDYVEMEYVTVLDPPRGLPGGVLGDRFYFASFEIPFFASEMLLALPKRMALSFDPRGDAPRPERREEGDLQIVRWRREAVAPLVQEPGSVSAREYIPSVQWGHRAGWDVFLEGLRDVLVDRDVADPAARRLAREVTGGARGEDGARKLHAWVIENIENDDDVFGVAARMLARRQGNRARVLRYLLELAGIEARLVIVRGFGADQTQSEFADEDTYGNLIVGVGSGDEVTYLTTAARGVPYGYLSPHLRGMDAYVLTPWETPREASKVRLPAATGGEERQRMELRVQLDPRGDGVVRTVERFRGAAAINWRNDLEAVPEAMLDQRFEEAYVARLFNGARMTTLRIAGQEDAEAELVFRYEALVPQLARPRGRGMALAPLVPSSLSARFAQLPERTTTMIVAPPLEREVVVRVQDTVLSELPEPVSIEGPGGARFTLEVRAEGDDVVLERRLRLPMMRVEPEAYAAFATFCRAVDEAEGRELRL